jgi:hypothetical protein
MCMVGALLCCRVSQLHPLCCLSLIALGPPCSFVCFAACVLMRGFAVSFFSSPVQLCMRMEAFFVLVCQSPDFGLEEDRRHQCLLWA